MLSETYTRLFDWRTMICKAEYRKMPSTLGNRQAKLVIIIQIIIMKFHQISVAIPA